MASKVVANAPNILSKLLRYRANSPYGATPLSIVTRTFSTNSSSWMYSPHVDNSDSHPFLIVGEMDHCRVDKTRNDCYTMRVDVPGIPKERMILWAETGKIYFSARDSEIPYYNYDGRVFGGSISFNPEKFNSERLTYDVRDGVLWITVPTLNN